MPKNTGSLQAESKKLIKSRVFLKGVLGTRFGSLELKIRSLESEKIGSLQVHTGYLAFSLKKACCKGGHRVKRGSEKTEEQSPPRKQRQQQK